MFIKRYLSASLAFVLGTGLSIAACIKTYQLVETYQLAELQQKLDRLASDIQSDFEANLEIVKTAATLYETTEGAVEGSTFEQFVKSPLYRHSGLQAIAWLPRPAATGEQNAIAAAFPPLQPEEKLGLERAVNSTFQSTFTRAIERQEILVTASTPLAGQSDARPRLLLIVPVYHQNSKKLERSERVKGFALGIFQIDSSLKFTLRNAKIEGLDLYLEDLMEPAPKRLIVAYLSQFQQFLVAPTSSDSKHFGHPVACLDGSGCTRILNIQNRRWRLQILLTERYKASQNDWPAWIVLGSGFLLTGLTTLYLHKLLKHTDKIEQIAAERTSQARQLQEALIKLEQTQVQLIHTEKMSSLGVLVAGLAHEINNPTNFIYGNIQYINQYAKDLVVLVELYRKHYPEPSSEVLDCLEAIEFEFIRDDLEKLSTSMQVGVERIIEIIQSLRQFSRMGGDGAKLANIQEGIDETLTLLQHRFKNKENRFKIVVIKDYQKLPLVECYPGQLNQVFMNILSNAIDAIESDWETGNRDEYTIKIKTRYTPADRTITVRISDNATGISEAVKNRLFEPFYTTKPVGKGTGLGLSISYQIVVERHGGALWCQSTLGKGTEFFIQLPVRSASDRETNGAHLTESSSETPVARLLENFWDGAGI